MLRIIFIPLVLCQLPAIKIKRKVYDQGTTMVHSEPAHTGNCGFCPPAGRILDKGGEAFTVLGFQSFCRWPVVSVASTAIRLAPSVSSCDAGSNAYCENELSSVVNKSSIPVLPQKLGTGGLRYRKANISWPRRGRVIRDKKLFYIRNILRPASFNEVKKTVYFILDRHSLLPQLLRHKNLALQPKE